MADVTLSTGLNFEIVQDEHVWHDPDTNVDYTVKFHTIRATESGYCYNVPSDALRRVMEIST